MAWSKSGWVGVGVGAGIGVVVVVCVVVWCVLVKQAKQAKQRIWNTPSPQDYPGKVPRRVWAFWFGKPMNGRRRASLRDMEATLGVPITLVTEDNLQSFLKWPVHPVVPHLSKIHQSDYYRIYFGLHYGGGYADIKPIQEDWTPHFEFLDTHPAAWVVGVPEIHRTVRNLAGPAAARHHTRYIRQSWFIARAGNPYFRAIHAAQNALLDRKGAAIKAHPPTHDRCCQHGENGYPVWWEELLGAIMCAEAPRYWDHIVPRMAVPEYRDYM